MKEAGSRPLLDGPELDAAIAVTRAFTFPGATGLGQSGLHDLLELELLNRANALAQAGPLNSWGTRPPHLAAILL